MIKGKKANYIFFGVIMIFICYIVKAFKPDFDVQSAINSITGLIALLVTGTWHMDYYSMSKGLQKKDKPK
jgi:hypothetical protein